MGFAGKKKYFFSVADNIGLIPKPANAKPLCLSHVRRSVGMVKNFREVSLFLATQKITPLIRDYFFPNSITSQFLISFPSIAKRIMVLTFCQPCLPAAPGFIYRHCNLSSYIIFKIWECPLIKSCGL